MLQIVSASADKTVAVWDANVGKRIRKCALHTGCVNSVAMPGAKGGQLYASGSDDGFVRVWDVRSKQAVHTLPHTYQVTKQPHACRRITIASRRDGGGWMAYASAHAHAHAYAQILAVELSADASKVFAGGIDNCVQVWDLAKGGEEPVDTYQGHADSITGLRLSPDGCVRACVRLCARRHGVEFRWKFAMLAGLIRPYSISPPHRKFLLSNGMDNTLRQWDVRPFVTGSRQVKVYQGATVRASPGRACALTFLPSFPPHPSDLIRPSKSNQQQHGSDRNLLRASWSADGEMVTVGSSDRAVHIFDVPSSQELYFLPGHKATVNEVVFSPVEPIIASASSDKTIFLGELA